MEWELVLCLTGNELHLRAPGAVRALCGTYPVVRFADLQPGEIAYICGHPSNHLFCTGCVRASAA